MYDVYCISAGQLDVKKDPNSINKKNLYLNYGLLGITSIIESYNLKPVQLHGHFEKPIDFLNHCIDIGITKTNYPVFISMPSFYALSWLSEFTRLLKNIAGIKHIVLGGRWVIDGEPKLLKKQLPDVDYIVDGLGENQIQKFLRIKDTYADISRYPILNYNLLENRKLYQPAVEVSRGCGMKCSFCQEGSEPLKPLKSPSLLIPETKVILLNDELAEMSPYFEASMFKPDKEWLNSLIAQRQIHSSSFKWRAESRVDSLSNKLIPLMSDAGLKVLDLGLESASHAQLKNMGKTLYPEKYLDRASALLRTAYEFGIDVKINILLYAGETSKTIEETYKWLDLHRKLIKGVSVGPVIAFGWEHKKRDFLKSLETLGAKVCLEDNITGITNIDLSKSISRSKSLDISTELSQEFMTHKDYYYLKSFSYFPRDYTYDEFVYDITSDKRNYNFKITDEVALIMNSENKVDLSPSIF